MSIKIAATVSPFPEFKAPLLMAGETEVAALAGKGQRVLVVEFFAFHTGKAVMQIATVQISVNDFSR
jgi:hypothetical protein